MNADTISIKGIDKSKLLAALYNRARPLGMGYLQFDPAPMSVEQAQGIVENTLSFDYLKGRVMKVSLKGDELDTWGYNRDNGPEAAERVVMELRKELEPA